MGSSLDQAIILLTNYLNEKAVLQAMHGSLITDRVKQLVRMRGPVIPSQISKEIGTNILLASAILSELASSSDVKISSVKFGGTPLYYVAGQEAKLQNYIASLPQKEKEAFEQLKAASVLRDSALEPAIRVALRQIKDFAKPIEASMDGQVELFWKWYLAPQDEAESAIKKIMGVEEKKPETAQQPVPQAVSPPSQLQQTVLAPQQQTVQPITIQQVRKQPKPPAKKSAPAVSLTEFSGAVKEFFAKNEIEIISETAAKKAEAEFIVLLPSPVGKLKYCCIAKGKKTCTDADISSAVVRGQLNKLPVLLLMRGELTKKAQELLTKEIGAIVIKNI